MILNIIYWLVHRGRSDLLWPLLAVAVASIAACSSGAGGTDPTPGTSASLKVVTTIYPVTYFAGRVGGGRIDVDSLAKPGVEAHDFEPSPGDIIELRNADVFIYTDPAFEVWVEDALDSLGNHDLIVVKTANVRGDFEIIEGSGTIDPHIWLNPLRSTEQVRAIQAAFTTADPDGTEEYAQNADFLVLALLELDRQFGAALESCILDTIVVSHLAYGHLAERYGLRQIGLADLSAEFETTPRRIADIIEQIELRGVGHILQEPILNDDLAKTVAAETGAEILPLHPLESLTQAELDAGDDYFSVMHNNLASLQTALECS